MTRPSHDFCSVTDNCDLYLGQWRQRYWC